MFEGALQTPPATIGTELVFSVSRDGGANWRTVAMVLAQDVGDGLPIYEGQVDFTGLPAGTSMVWRAQNTAGKDFRIAGVYFQWGE